MARFAAVMVIVLTCITSSGQQMVIYYPETHQNQHLERLGNITRDELLEMTEDQAVLCYSEEHVPREAAAGVLEHLNQGNGYIGLSHRGGEGEVEDTKCRRCFRLKSESESATSWNTVRSYSHVHIGCLETHDVIRSAMFENTTSGWSPLMNFYTMDDIYFSSTEFTQGAWSVMWDRDRAIQQTFNLPTGTKAVVVTVDSKTNWLRSDHVERPDTYMFQCDLNLSNGTTDTVLQYGEQGLNTWRTFKLRYSASTETTIDSARCFLYGRVVGRENKSWWDNMRLYYSVHQLARDGVHGCGVL